MPIILLFMNILPNLVSSEPAANQNRTSETLLTHRCEDMSMYMRLDMVAIHVRLR